MDDKIFATSLESLLSKQMDDALAKIQRKTAGNIPINRYISIIRTELRTAVRTAISAIECKLRIAATEELCKHTRLSADARNELLDRASAFLAVPDEPLWAITPWPHTKGTISGAASGAAIGAFSWLLLVSYPSGQGYLLQQLEWCFMGAIAGGAIHEAAWLILRQYKIFNSKKSFLPFLRKHYEHLLADGLARYLELLYTELSSAAKEEQT